MYKLKTAKVFEKPKSRSVDVEDDPFAVQVISLCAESRKLCVAGASSHVILFTYKRSESNEEVYWNFGKKVAFFEVRIFR